MAYYRRGADGSVTAANPTRQAIEGGGYQPRTGGPLNYQPGGMGGGQMPDYTRNMLDQIFKSSTEGSLQSFNTASNRLRERLGSEAEGFSQDALSHNLGRGFGASGANDADQFRIRQGQMDAYAQGLGNLESQFEDRRLQGLGIANQAAGISGDWDRSYMQDQGQTNRQNSMNTWQGGQNSQDRSARMRLEEMSQKGQNWRQSQNNMFNVPNLFQSLNTSRLIGSGGGATRYGTVQGASRRNNSRTAQAPQGYRSSVQGY